MNKRTARWISLILSLAVMVGSITYLAVGADAATEEPTDPFIYSEHDYTSKDGANAEARSTNEDELIGSKTTFTYTKVLNDGEPLVEENEDYDIYFDMYNKSGVNSVTEGVPFTVVVTMENSTAPDYSGSFEKEKTEYTSTDVTSLKLGLLYDADAFELTKCESNLGEDVVFTETGSGSSSGIVAEYDDVIRACEMPYFEFTFTPLKDFEDITEISLDENSEVEPEKDFTVGYAEPMEFTVYNSGDNNTLSELTLNYTSGKESHTAYLYPEFDPEITEYFTTIPADADITVRSDVLRKETESKASSTVEPFTLNTGLNEMNITVKSKNGEERVYTIYIKKLAENTLADPKTVLTKTVEYNEPGKVKYEYYDPAKKDTVTVNADGAVYYTISGVNDLLAPGNGYVIAAPAKNIKDIYDYIIENTANLKDSVIIVDVLNDSGDVVGVKEFRNNLDDPSNFAALEAFIKAPTGGTDNPETQIKSLTVDGNKYLFELGVVEPAEDGDPDYFAIEPTADGYTLITLEDEDDKLDAALAEIEEVEPDAVDNTAAEYVIITDFSDAQFNEALQQVLFGYPEGKARDGKGILGYIEHVQNSLSNDSTAKVTLIALGADYKTGEDEEGEPYPENILDDEDVYGLYSQIVNHDEGRGIEGNFALPLNEDYEAEDDLPDNVYRSQTFTLPLVAKEDLWGSTTLGTSEQNNISNYANSFSSNRSVSGHVNTMSVKQTNSTNNPRLATQYNDAVAEAKEILDGAKNPQLIILSADNVSAANSAVNGSGVKSLVGEPTVVNVKDYVDNTASANPPYSTSKNTYNALVTEDPSGFICDPAGSESSLGLIDPINSQIFWIKNADISANGYSYDLYDPELDAPADYYDALWYLPSIGKYELDGSYCIVRRIDKDAVSKLKDGHYYPISDTIDTKVLGATEEPILDDIPTVAVTYDDKYALDIVKGADFAKKDGATPLSSTVTYVVKYANEGVETLTNVEITDTKILAAKNYKAYIVDNGKNPTSTDKTVTLEFSDMEDTNYPFKGYASLASLAPGKTLYLTYELVVPEVMNVTSGTSGYAKDDPAKVIQNYILENTATGSAKELDDAVMAKLDTEFRYDASNGTTSGSATSTTATSTTTKATTPTVPSYNPAVPTTATVNVPVQQVVVPTGESLIGYIVAISLLFGAVGVFGVTIYGMVLDDRIEKAKAAKLSGIKH